MDFKERFKKTVRAAASKTNELATTAKVKMDISQKKTKIQKLYKDIGRKSYEAYKNQEDVHNLLVGYYEKIDILQEEIDTLEQSQEAH